MLPYQNLSLEDMPGEIWKDIPQFEGLYMVSSLGRIKSVGTPGLKGWKGQTRILRHRYNRKGYHLTALYKDGLRFNPAIARLVALVFIPNPDNKPQVDHIDNNKHNNSVDNLRWVTSSENMKNEISVAHRKAVTKGRFLYGAKGKKPKHGAELYNAKPIVGINLTTKEVVNFECISATREHGFFNANVSKVCRKIMTKTHGWTFFYKDDPELKSYLANLSECQGQSS